MPYPKIKVGVLGATGAVGQKFVQLLTRHPWFELTEVVASEKSQGKTYGEAAHWLQNAPIAANIRALPVKPCQPNLDCEIVFSALDASVAGEVEAAFAAQGYAVFSNARNHRMAEDVPLLVPEINAEHFALIVPQQKNRHCTGFIATNPNCSTVFLSMLLAPLEKRFGVEKVFVVTMQAISGAGYPGVSALDIHDNVIPFINGEEEKIETETRKILGKLRDGHIEFAEFAVSAQANRVAVENGHTECMSIKLKKEVTEEEFKACLREFRGLPQELNLPSAPSQPILVLEENDRPQPKRDILAANGMATLVGRIRPCPILDYRCVVLGHNTIRGAAGAAILNAEFWTAKNRRAEYM